MAGRTKRTGETVGDSSTIDVLLQRKTLVSLAVAAEKEKIAAAGRWEGVQEQTDFCPEGHAIKTGAAFTPAGRFRSSLGRKPPPDRVGHLAGKMRGCGRQPSRQKSSDEAEHRGLSAALSEGY